ncbi:MAG: Histidine--tRNA ligase, partial [Verrucomicrobiales bacterium]|nr:Histidine--tRNA ligase [Verrucomicrobiales bacterium]
WFAIPQLFRYERQQKGRLREHFQFNADILGENDSSSDAELLALLIDSLRAFGLKSDDFVIRLSSRNAWQDFFQKRNGKPEHSYEFYQVIDKLEREEPAESEKKLAAIGFSLNEVNEFITSGQPTPELDIVVKNLQARGLGEYVKIDYHVIRGLAYYTGVVFEAFDRKGEFRAIAGGGRYDNLVKLISGGKIESPALGFGMGDVVLLELLKARGLLPKFDSNIAVFVMIEDEALRNASLQLVQQIRDAGHAVDYAFTPAKSDKQFKRAMELKARYTVKIEADPTGALGAKLKNLSTREEKLLAPSDIASAIS